ncbi:MAG: hypothetical protein LAO09_18955 [Acidobacteriia bacterium]|nr:hypothetical protein [Terriglobia bacterium]
MATTKYRRALYEAKQDLARCLVERQKIDRKVARLQTVVSDLENLCGELEHKSFVTGVERVIKANLKLGITEMTRVILKQTFFPLTATQLQEKLVTEKLQLSRYANPLAVIHTVLKRLVKSGEVRVIPQAHGKKAYQWVTTTDKLLTELRQGDQPVQRSPGVKEGK